MKHSTHRDLLVTYWLFFDDVDGDASTAHSIATVDVLAYDPKVLATASSPPPDDPT